ncbi:ABC transporter ATP-binding protein [Methermicoccus shengliensis]|uniref:ABC transporter ATP-binding protein n=1 Tax=Methermicoccus shengliensis TaxID=660064 RepID=A0A832RWE9_9EURY|nr:ABC transporter ATP-binding protein [Methermicoccus shengliensis]KUK04189.1 MAG: ABC transporter related protein [Euryarchaeota archaeon 55_53]KUK29886.1 MAG: ABC transporter related protein [Methanosarcinales archeaon 56_1174]MDN5295853.1 putative transport system ATP-binding protein [Methanosarcinales archaeon]HIH69488.1 ABC transporter ATP-binding protein [Methermicoccus shengliensis]
MSDTIVELRDVRKVYKIGEAEVPAVDGVNLRIKREEFLAIVGPSGSGKSTLLHMIGCLDKPTSGEIFLDGTEISKLKDNELARLRGRKIGFVFQQFNLHPNLTALENVELPMAIVEKERKERRERALELLRIVGMEERAAHFPSQMSGGQMQRVAIARAIANDPDLILADEPTGNLDSKSGSEVMRYLLSLQENGKTVVMITHDLSIAELAKRVIHIKDGKIVGEVEK